MKKTIALLILLFLFTTDAKTDDKYYFYGVVKANIKKVSDNGRDRIVIDIPFTLYSQYFVSEGVSLTYSRDLKNEGKEIMALIAVKREDEEALKDWPGYIGDNFDTVKRTATYAKHYPHTIGEMRSYTDDEGTLIPYLGFDKDDPARFCLCDT